MGLRRLRLRDGARPGRARRTRGASAGALSPAGAPLPPAPENEGRFKFTESTEQVEEVVGELVPVEPEAPSTLFRTSDPDVALERMAEVARSLVAVVEDRKLYVTIAGKKHLLVGAWTTLGAMLGLFPVVAWTRENE